MFAKLMSSFGHRAHWWKGWWRNTPFSKQLSSPSSSPLVFPNLWLASFGRSPASWPCTPQAVHICAACSSRSCLQHDQLITACWATIRPPCCDFTSNFNALDYTPFPQAWMKIPSPQLILSPPTFSFAMLPDSNFKKKRQSGAELFDKV